MLFRRKSSPPGPDASSASHEHCRVPGRQAVFALREMWKHLGFHSFDSPAHVELGLEISELLYSWLTHAPEVPSPPDQRLPDHPAASGATSRIEQLLAEIDDEALTALWRVGTWSALNSLLAHLLLRRANPEALLWHGLPAETRTALLAKQGPPPAELSAEDWRLVKTVAAAFPDLKPLTRPGSRLFQQRGGVVLFNPLALDWQARRLAEKLRINIVPMGHAAWQAVCGGHEQLDAIVLFDDCGGDRAAARRRAVVECAANLLRHKVAPAAW